MPPAVPRVWCDRARGGRAPTPIPGSHRSGPPDTRCRGAPRIGGQGAPRCVYTTSRIAPLPYPSPGALLRVRWPRLSLLIALGVLAIVSSACKSAHPAQPAPLVAVAAKRSVPRGNAPPSALASASPSPSPTPLAPPVCPFGTDDASLAAALAAQHTDLRSLPQGIAPFSYPLEYGGGDLESAVYFAASVGVVEVTGVTIGQPDGLDAGLPVDVEFRLVQALKGDPATQSPLHAV